MAQILVVADSAEEAGSTVVYRETISSADLESDHFSGQLVERVAWAVGDAKLLEHKSRRPLPTKAQREISAAA
jgi:hypothetical protein